MSCKSYKYQVIRIVSSILFLLLQLQLQLQTFTHQHQHQHHASAFTFTSTSLHLQPIIDRSASTISTLTSLSPTKSLITATAATAITKTNTKTNTNTALYGIDFDAIGEDEECDFTDGDLSLIDFSKCLPFPSVDIEPEDVVILCMESLLNNNEPTVNAGLEVCFNFSSDRCRAVNGGSLEKFVNFASNPTFQSMVNAREYKIISVGPLISAGQTRGAMKTVLISVLPRNINLKERRFLWTMQQERRPPKQGFWLVHECIAVDNTFATTL